MKDLIMGNEESHYPKVEVEEEAVEVTDNWSLHYARAFSGTFYTRSAFVSQPDSNRCSKEPLERLAKNLMVHRHPCIVKYISSWTKNNRFYLITEEVKPLAQVLKNQSTLQICIGLHSILTALVFLHEKAASSHNNLCCASIYVTPEGVWKLGGLEYLKKLSEVTPSYLQEARSHRYERAVPPEEDSLISGKKVNTEAIDAYAFGVLVEELLRKKTNDEITCLSEFREHCKTKLQSSDPAERCKLTEIILHPFFSHDFIKIHRFLVELPLKLEHEKEQFFRDLIEQLNSLPEVIVGSQLASLLLSRIVMLDRAAQQHFLPIVLQPKTGSECPGVALFSQETFKLHVVPKLLQMFCVRDAQIRLILLNHFHSFCNMFTKDQLQHHVLPELLVGIKDVNDQLVSVTLKALSELVMILGASTVIGGKRTKLFTDGRPKSHNCATTGDHKLKLKDRNRSSPLKRSSQLMFDSELPERPSPDGGEDNSSSTTVEEQEIDTENWSDWELSGDNRVTPEVPAEPEKDSEEKPKQSEEVRIPPAPCHVLPDITALDIKSSISTTRRDSKLVNGDDDFFRDMEPVISKTQIHSIDTTNNKFDVASGGAGGEEGWDDTLEDWGAESEANT